ncbi:hypothetical protein BIY24_15065 [Halobacteriovorax marinus]|uniref:hypothetical protein n=1 Tax=Halobacteriovorax marinus TaxID=97084 RepID=UPI000BC35024|nr:hypothetical protein [Halobacteriovorax marinus]ATH09215.1 hypothetical protein BIY24_15065 [Halobacteriovorax marinus]
MELNRENKYLVTYLVALFFLTLILWFINLSFQTLNYIILGFCWSFTIHAPSLRERLELKKYKFSLLRFVFGVDNFLVSLSSKFYLRILLRSIPPIIISFLCFLISMKGIFMASLIGGLYFELIFQRKRLLKLIKFRTEGL